MWLCYKYFLTFLETNLLSHWGFKEVQTSEGGSGVSDFLTLPPLHDNIVVSISQCQNSTEAVTPLNKTIHSKSFFFYCFIAVKLTEIKTIHITTPCGRSICLSDVSVNIHWRHSFGSPVWLTSVAKNCWHHFNYDKSQFSEKWISVYVSIMKIVFSNLVLHETPPSEFVEISS